MQIFETLLDYLQVFILYASRFILPLLVLLIFFIVRFIRTDAQNTSTRSRYKRYIILSAIALAVLVLGTLTMFIPAIFDSDEGYYETPQIRDSHHFTNEPQITYEYDQNSAIALFTYEISEEEILLGYFDTQTENGKTKYCYLYSDILSVGYTNSEGWWSGNTRYYYSDWRELDDGIWIAIIPKCSEITPDPKRTVDFTDEFTIENQTWTVYIAVDTVDTVID